MKMDEFRRQLATTQWPIVIRVDGKEIEIDSKDDHISTIRRDKQAGRPRA
jgi:hypothetical protein